MTIYSSFSRLLSLGKPPLVLVVYITILISSECYKLINYLPMILGLILVFLEAISNKGQF